MDNRTIAKILVPALKHFAPQSYPATCSIVAQMDKEAQYQFHTPIELHNEDFFVWWALRAAGHALECIHIDCFRNNRGGTEDITWRVNASGELQIIASVTKRQQRAGLHGASIQRHNHVITIKINEEGK